MVGDNIGLFAVQDVRGKAYAKREVKHGLD
jgi:hypothetical protein